MKALADIRAEALVNLCACDPRNPDAVEDATEPGTILPRKDPCYCDNCFYGRTDMAETILQLLDKIERTISQRTTAKDTELQRINLRKQTQK